MLRTLWSKLFTQQPAPARKRPTAQLLLESLEGREVPSACRPKARPDDYCCVNVGQKFYSPFSVLQNDSGKHLKAVLVCGPKHGSLSLSKNGKFCYTADGKWTGATDTFTYKAVDCRTGKVSCKTTVTLHLNWCPVANNDYFNSPQSLPVSGNVLSNDYDPDHGPKPLRVTSINVGGKEYYIPDGGYTTVNTAGGKVEIYSNGSFEYTPNPSFTGTDMFRYTITDGCCCASANVCVTVAPGSKANLFAR
jgi:hypothetical protein